MKKPTGHDRFLEGQIKDLETTCQWQKHRIKSLEETQAANLAAIADYRKRLDKATECVKDAQDGLEASRQEVASLRTIISRLEGWIFAQREARGGRITREDDPLMEHRKDRDVKRDAKFGGPFDHIKGGQ